MNSFFLEFLAFLLVINNVYGASIGPTVKTDQKKVYQTIPFAITLTEFADTYVVLNLTGPKVVSGTDFLRSSKPFNLTIQIEKFRNRKSVWIDVLHGFNFTLVEKVNDFEKFNFLMKIDKLLPNQKYRFIIRALYSNENVMYSFPSSLDVTMKALAPKGTVNKQVSVSLSGTNVKTYYVQVDKVARRNKLVTVINSTIEASHGDIKTLDNLNSGSRYSIKLWYMDNNKKVSAIKTIDYRA